MSTTRFLLRSCALGLTVLASSWSSAAPLSSGCGRTLASGTYRMTDQNITRIYRVLVPSRYEPDTAYPLIAVFHGWGGDENEFLGDKRVRTLADERGYIVVAPRGLGSGAPDLSPNSWSFRGSTTGVAGSGDGDNSRSPEAAATPICDATRTRDFTYPSCRHVARNTCSWTQCQTDDVTFALALIKEVESKLCVDTARVFASGGSNGAMFTWELGQNPASASIFRALAALIGLPHRGYLDAPGKKGALPVLVITGTRDTTVPPGDRESTKYTTTSDGNAYYYTGASAIVRSWGAANNCPYRGTPAASFNAGAPRADCRSYCGGNAEGWSGGAAGAGWPNVLDCRATMAHAYDFSWSWKLMLDFFDAHSH